MNKSYVSLLSFLIVFFIYSCAQAYDKKIEKDLYEIYLKTKINLYDALNRSKDTIFINEVKLLTWVGPHGGSLQDSDFLSEDNKKEIRMKFSAHIDIKVSSGLYGSIRMARFNNQQDAILAFRDSGPYSTGIDLNSLFSGKKIDSATLCSQNLHNIIICSHIMYKGYTFRITLRRTPSKVPYNLAKKDYDFADSLILVIKDLIDKSK